MIDSRNLDDLHPTLARGARELIKRMKEKGFDVLVTSTYRDYEMQNMLYAKGRTLPGNVVTNARGGQSFHNHKLAFDICQNIKGKEYSNVEFFQTAGKIWKEMGGTWGGNFLNFPDRPHFQYTEDLTLSKLTRGGTLYDTAKMKWEVKRDEELGIDDEVVDKTTVIYNEQEITVERILKNNTNYIKLRDLEKFGMKIYYDEVDKMAVIFNR